MFVRIVRPQIAAGKAQEAATKWKEFLGPRAKANPNFKAGYMAATPDGGSVVAVTVWEQLPDPEMTRQLQGEIAAHLGDLATGPPTTEDYEVLGQI